MFCHGVQVALDNAVAHVPALMIVDVRLDGHPVVEKVVGTGDRTKLTFGWIGSKSLKILNDHQINTHMTVMDKSGYRLEHGEIDAEANFGHPTFAGTLAALFDTMAGKAELQSP